jgi:predicted transcriptional regulator
MRWSELVKALDATVLVPGGDFHIRNVAAADLLSDILACEKEEFVILTGQVTSPAIRTALAVGALGVVVVRGKRVPEETIDLSASYGIPLAVTDAMMFEASVTLGGILWSSPTSKS